MKTYREFPIRVGELGIVHRAEKSGTLHGLMRARCFTQDDAHIFMRDDKVPFMLIIGEKEQQAKAVSVRARDAEPEKQDMGQMGI